jgi:hypothetical protein
LHAVWLAGLSVTTPISPDAGAPAGAVDDPASVGAPALDRRAVAIVAAEGSDEVIEEFVANLPKQRLASAILQIHALRSALMKAERWCESRYGEEVGGNYTDTETGDQYVFGGEPRWFVADAAGFAAELARLANAKPLWRHRIHEAYKRTWAFNNTVLNSIRDLDEEIGNAVREFRQRKWGPKHLRRFDE